MFLLLLLCVCFHRRGCSCARGHHHKIGFWSLAFGLFTLAAALAIVIPVLAVWGIIRIVQWRRSKWDSGHGSSSLESRSSDSPQPWRASTSSILDMLDD